MSNFFDFLYTLLFTCFKFKISLIKSGRLGYSNEIYAQFGNKLKPIPQIKKIQAKVRTRTEGVIALQTIALAAPPP